MPLLRSFICFVLLSLCSAQGAEVIAQISGNEAEAGAGVLLSVEIKGGKAERPPTFPDVENLIINERGQSTQIGIVNGKMNRSVTYTYVVGSMQEGEYVVPAATMKVDGKELKTQTFKLVVKPSANGAPPGMDGQEGSEEAEATAGDHGYLTFQLGTSGREHVYPGEIAPVRIRAYFPANSRVSLKGNPRPVGSAFTLNNLSEEPQQSRETVNGKQYLTVTWFGGLSATKAGKYPASFELEGQVGTSSRVHGSFFPRMVTKDITLTTEDPPEIEVRELPKEGRPKDFTGAIGQFEFGSLRVPKQLEAGEPTRVEAILKGEGNFSLLREPHPIPQADWKIYDGSSNFTAGDVASFAGEKRFQFNVVPLVPGNRPLSFGFSYFDPDKGEYEIVISDPQQITITGEASVQTETAQDKEPGDKEPEEPELAPLMMKFGAVRSYVPVAKRGWFLPVTVGSCGVTALLFGFTLWRSRGVDQERLAHKANEAASRRAMSKAEKAVSSGDGTSFFMAARDVIRIRVAEQTGVRAEAVTVADLRELESSEISEILNEVDRIGYSGKSTSMENLSDWKATLDRALVKLKESGRKVA